LEDKASTQRVALNAPGFYRAAVNACLVNTHFGSDTHHRAAFSRKVLLASDQSPSAYLGADGLVALQPTPDKWTALWTEAQLEAHFKDDFTLPSGSVAYCHPYGPPGLWRKGKDNLLQWLMRVDCSVKGACQDQYGSALYRAWCTHTKATPDQRLEMICLLLYYHWAIGMPRPIGSQRASVVDPSLYIDMTTRGNWTSVDNLYLASSLVNLLPQHHIPEVRSGPWGRGSFTQALENRLSYYFSYQLPNLYPLARMVHMSSGYPGITPSTQERVAMRETIQTSSCGILPLVLIEISLAYIFPQW
jgi:hypothetical protein